MMIIIKYTTTTINNNSNNDNDNDSNNKWPTTGRPSGSKTTTNEARQIHTTRTDKNT